MDAPRMMGRAWVWLVCVLGAALVGSVGGCANSTGFNAPYPPEPVREYRGVWVATVSNIDWPSRPGLPPEQMRAEMDRILDTASRLNLNAVFLQVRPACDAIYPSELEPWSEFLSGTQGAAPGGAGFDPLAEWVSAAHRRGIELHAWFNPFRARQGAKGTLASGHVGVAHPEWVREYGDLLWLDPGEPAAREHSLRVVLDVVRRYDVDGVHFDDYFYPYPKKDVAFPDDGPFARYTEAGGTLGRSDWRRENINTFVREVSGRVHAAKPWVRVGISPFGIWRPGHPRGVQGFDAYEGLAADSMRWLEAGWVDYLAPQLYWKIDSAQPYGALLDWWLAASKRAHGRPILVGNFTSKLSDRADDAKAWRVEEILDQITRTRDRALVGAAGNIHFSAVALTQNRRGIADALAQGPYAEAAIPFEARWLAHGARPGAPRVDVPAESGEMVVVRWKSHEREGYGLRRWLVWSRHGGMWSMRVVADADHAAVQRVAPSGELERVAVAEVDCYGRVGSLALLWIAPMGEPAGAAQAAMVSP